MPGDLVALMFLTTMLAAGWGFVSARRRTPPDALPSPEELAARHRRARPGRLLLRGATILLYAYVLARSFDLLPTTERLGVRNPALILFLPIVGLWIGTGAGLALRRSAIRRWLRTRPEHAGGLAPGWQEALPLLASALWFGALYLAVLRPGPLTTGATLGGLIVLVRVVRAATLGAARRTAIPLDPDSDLARRIADLAARFGLPPGRYVEMRSLVANAWAAPDGRAYLTTTLRRLVGDDGVVAVLAHEFEHLRAGDAKGLQRRRTAGLLACLVVAAGVAVAPAFLRRGDPAWTGPATALGTLVLAPWFLRPFARFSREREFAADAAAARESDPRAFAEALRLLHLWNGVAFSRGGPSATHPPLTERLARLEGGAGILENGQVA